MAYQKMTEGKFKAIKILLSSGATHAEISESLGISDYVIRFVKASETFEEYRHKMYVNSAGYRKKVEAEQKKKEEEAKAAAEKAVAEKAPAEQAEKKEYKEPEVQVVEHRQSVQIQATHFMTEELREMKELLKGISNKLAFIVEELTGEVKSS